MLVQP